MTAQKQRRRRRRSLLQKQSKMAKVSERKSQHTSVVRKNKAKEGVLMEGFMKKRGVWSRAFKSRYFVLFESRQMHYYGEYKHGVASDERGVADLSNIESVVKRGETSLEV